MLEFKINKTASETVKKLFSVYSQVLITDYQVRNVHQTSIKMI